MTHAAIPDGEVDEIRKRHDAAVAFWAENDPRFHTHEFQCHHDRATLLARLTALEAENATKDAALDCLGRQYKDRLDQVHELRAELAASREKFTMHTAAVHAWFSALLQEMGIASEGETVDVATACSKAMDWVGANKAENALLKREVLAADRLVTLADGRDFVCVQPIYDEIAALKAEVAEARANLERANRIIGWMMPYIGNMCPPDNGLFELNEHCFVNKVPEPADAKGKPINQAAIRSSQGEQGR